MIDREKFFKEIETKIKSELESTDQKIIFYSLIIEKLPSNINELFEQMRIITDLKYPTLDQYLTIEEYATYLLEDTLEEHKRKEIENIPFENIGINLTETDKIIVNDLAKIILDLIKLRKHLDSEISNLLKENYPNFFKIATPKIATKMLQIAGSFKRLSEMPASTLQLLGAEKSFFRALKLNKKTPKYGVLYNHELLFSLNKKNKPKMARFIANKLFIALKADLNNNYISEDLYSKMINRKNNLLNSEKKK